MSERRALDMDRLGVIHGRFQGLHLGHMEYLLAGAARCEHLLIGISNFDPKEAPAGDLIAFHRNLSANPFSYYERMVMLRDSLTEAGLDRARFDLIPFPIEFPARIPNFAPPDAVYYMTIYDHWGERKYEILKGLGLHVEIMWVRDDSSRITSGTEVRRRIAEGLPWEHLVPAAVSRYISTNDLTGRMRSALIGV